MALEICGFRVHRFVKHNEYERLLGVLDQLRVVL